MKRFLILLCLGLLLAIPTGLYALDDMFDTGASTNSGSGALLNAGIWALTHADKISSLPEKLKEGDDKKPPDETDKKVDDAIKKAWAD